MTYDAVIDPSGLYRYSLTRRWGIGTPNRVCFMMLNPSTANASADDPTIRRCIGFAKRWGHDSLEVVNVFALRTSDPAKLLLSNNPLGMNNHAYIQEAFVFAEKIVVAWGASVSVVSWLPRHIMADHKHKLFCLGLTKTGHPRHPLYVKADTELIHYELP